MCVEVPGEECGLEENEAGVPHGGRSAEEWQQHTTDQRLNAEQQERTDEKRCRREQYHDSPSLDRFTGWRVWSIVVMNRHQGTGCDGGVEKEGIGLVYFTLGGSKMSIELTTEQASALETEGDELIVINPRTKLLYRLVPEMLYRQVRDSIDASPWTSSEMALLAGEAFSKLDDTDYSEYLRDSP